MKKLSRYILAAFLAIFVASPILAIASPVQQTAGAIECEQRFLGIPPWFRGMTKEEKVNGVDTCIIKSPENFKTSSDESGLAGFIWKIVLNVIEMALVIAAYIAVFFIIYGGFLFVTNGSSPDGVTRARKTILNAVIGLVISMGAIAITNFVFGIFDSATGEAQLGGDGTGIQVISGELLLKNILNITFFVLGTISVIVIIIAGLNYATSSGDAGRVTKAKNMLLYAVVGLIVAVSAFAITNFIIGRFS